MNEPTPRPDDELANMSREEMLSLLFSNMVIQQTNMAMMLMGKVAHPESGQFMHDLEAARMFIDQLEMLEAKTKGNLSKQEEGLLKQALAAVRMTFVETVETPVAGESPTVRAAQPAPVTVPESAAADATASHKPAPAAPPAPPAETPAAADESRKKFSKKY